MNGSVLKDWLTEEGRFIGYFSPMQNHFIPYNPILKARARQLRNNMTKGEVILWQRLKKKQMMGYDFDRQKPIDQFIVDFYCKSLLLAIEVDGAIHDSEEAQQRDQVRQSKLEGLGVRFLRFRDDDVRYNTNAVCLTIANWIRENQVPSIS
jgi:very-short-patch-repair endonuclease